MQRSNKVSHLNVKIDQRSINAINQAIKILNGLPLLSANDLKKEFKMPNLQSTLFQGIFNFLSQVEEIKTQTYADSREKMTFGVGLNIKDDNTEAVLHAVNPEWSGDTFKKMQTEQGQPPNPISIEQVKQILYYTLIGAEYGELKFVGKITTLINQLESHSPGLSEVKFAPHELIALQSLAFNNRNLIGQDLCKVLREFKASNDPLNVVLEIMTHSNKLNNADVAGIQNRRMQEAGLFLADPAAMHITYSQYKRIKAALKTLGIKVEPQNGKPIYASPYDREEKSSGYIGGDNVINKGENYHFGSYKADTFHLPEVDPVAFGGDGSDIFHIDSTQKRANPNEENYPYLAGNKGFDVYDFGDGVTDAFIYDEDSHGQVKVRNEPIEGIALPTDTTNKNFVLRTSNKQIFNLTRTDENSLEISNNANTKISIGNYQGGQFNLVLTHAPTNLFTGNFYSQPKKLASGNFVTITASSGYMPKQLFAIITTPTGQLVNTIALANAAPDVPNETQSGFTSSSVSTLPNGDFVCAWLYEYKRLPHSIPFTPSPNGNGNSTNGGYTKETLETQIQGVVCNQQGITNQFTIVLPNGMSVCTRTFGEKNKPQGCRLGAPQVISGKNGFIVFYHQFVQESETFLFCQNSMSLRSNLIPTNSKQTLLTAAPTKRGYFVIALGETDPFTQIQTLTTAICTPNGNIVQQFAHGKIVGQVALCPVDEGYMLAMGNPSAKSINTAIFNGRTWSPVSPTYIGNAMVQQFILGASVKGHTLVSWQGVEIIGSQYFYPVGAVFIDPYNKMVGDITTFTVDGSVFPTGIALTSEDNTMLQFAGVTSSGITTVNNHLIETSNMKTASFEETRIGATAATPKASSAERTSGLLHSLINTLQKSVTSLYDAGKNWLFGYENSQKSDQLVTNKLTANQALPTTSVINKQLSANSTEAFLKKVIPYVLDVREEIPYFKQQNPSASSWQEQTHGLFNSTNNNLPIQQIEPVQPLRLNN